MRFVWLELYRRPPLPYMPELPLRELRGGELDMVGEMETGERYG
jgi:hypothetical protein